MVETFSGKTLKEFHADGKEVVIRYPRMSDLEDIMEFMNSVVEEGSYLNMQKRLKRKEEIEWLSNALKGNERGDKIYLVVEVDGRVLGSASVEPKVGAKSHVAEFGIAIHKDIRGIGIGTELAETIFSETRERLEIELIKLEVFQENERARNFYDKLGFESVGIIHEGALIEGNYQDLIIMQRDLD